MLNVFSSEQNKSIFSLDFWLSSLVRARPWSYPIKNNVIIFFFFNIVAFYFSSFLIDHVIFKTNIIMIIKSRICFFLLSAAFINSYRPIAQPAPHRNRVTTHRLAYDYWFTNVSRPSHENYRLNRDNGYGLPRWNTCRRPQQQSGSFTRAGKHDGYRSKRK